MQPQRHPEGRPAFDQPVEIDIADDDMIIYLNPAQKDALVAHQKRYEKRLTEHPKSLQAKVKLIAITLLLSGKSVTSAQVIDQLMNDGNFQESDLPHLAGIVVNTFQVIGSYNTGNPELLARVRPAKEAVPDAQADKTQRTRNAVAALLLPPNETELAIGLEIRKLLQIGGKGEISAPKQRREILHDLANYLAANRQESPADHGEEILMQRLTKNLPDTVNHKTAIQTLMNLHDQLIITKHLKRYYEEK